MSARLCICCVYVSCNRCHFLDLMVHVLENARKLVETGWLDGWLVAGYCCSCPRNLYVSQWLYNRNMCYVYLLHTNIFSLWWHWCHFNLGFSCTHLASEKEWNLRELHFVYRFTYTISSFFHVEWVCVCVCVYVSERANFFDYEIKCFPNGCEHTFFHFHVKNSSEQSTKTAKHFSIKCTQNFLSFSQRTPFFRLLSFLTPIYLENLRFRRCCCCCWMFVCLFVSLLEQLEFQCMLQFRFWCSLCGPGPRKFQKC